MILERTLSLAVLFLLSSAAFGTALSSTMPKQDDDEILGGKWMLKSLKGEKKDASYDENMKVVKKAKIWIEFKRNRVVGSGGCNTCQGKFEATGDGKLFFQDLGYTEMACSDQEIMKLEAHYFAAIYKVSKFKLLDKRLVLSDSTGKIEIVYIPFVEEKGMPLAGTTWNLLTFEVSEGKGDTATDSAESVLKNAPITLTIKDGKASGSSGVNVYGASTKIGEGTISFGSAMSSRRAGPPEAMQQEARYYTTLAKVTRFVIRGNRLTLSNDDGSIALSFKGSE